MSGELLGLILALVGYLLIVIPLWQSASEAKRVRVLLEWWWREQHTSPHEDCDARTDTTSNGPAHERLAESRFGKTFCAFLTATQQRCTP